jgi:hypothetical protein
MLLSPNENRSEGRGSACQQPGLLQQIDQVGDEVGDGVIDHNVTVVVSHLVARRWWGQIAVDIRRQGMQIADIRVGVIAADCE